MSNNQIHAIESALDQQIARLNRTQNLNLGIAAVLIIFLIGYMGYLSSLTAQIDAEGLVDVAVDKADEQLPILRKELATSLVEGAEGNINELINTGLEFVPEQRKNLEKYVSDVLQKNVIIMDEGFSELFKNVLVDARPQLEPMLKKVTDAKTTLELEEEIYAIFHANLDQPEVLSDVDAYGEILMNVADKVEYLRTSDSLSKSEQRELLLLQALREISIRSDKENPTL
ncbi:MAG: hypothetical protein SFY68_08665 [Candidatus Sumerlaeia bacterium]|nr:hypothetical protein [Candidatus Sumerlaeia bacterium]